MDKREELHEKAWGLLKERGFKLGEMMMIRSSFVEWSGYKEENPFIEKSTNSRGEYYHSTHDLIKHYSFKTEDEVVLANAIYLNMNEGCTPNDFIQIFKFTCRTIGLNNDWT
tara:strand:+ start:333 stop:668 length:336 start_codon:yes stop_codon:yes gene_type:complete